ncbi:Lrp/AsnC family transcriptional regulator [Marivibrio halodurans]|uniref:Lrp/AsnC family transcriptional regulator n=1 Tax=Marivibrio halodurans TaxID=2039722 RepID=A0A8J7V1L5_9PROT|nr:Lrp/AsnC family transcriptional regulator [Marivibrio halodurans]
MDDTDRRILRLLAEDATRTYAELGRRVHLSPPAVHERVRRLKRDGVIRGTVARLDGTAIGCPLLAFIHVETEGRAFTRTLDSFAAIADVEEVHTVAGDAGVVLKVRTRDTGDLERLLARLYEMEGVRAAKSFVVLGTYLERGPHPDIDL